MFLIVLVSMTSRLDLPPPKRDRRMLKRHIEARRRRRSSTLVARPRPRRGVPIASEKGMQAMAMLARVLLVFTGIGLPATALAQPQDERSMRMCPGCPMMGGGGMWIGMVLFGLLIVAAIVALVALTIFLIRRSGPRGPRHA